MPEIRLYPLIIQTWLQGRGASLLSGQFHDAQILKWAKEEVLKWNDPRCPQENEVLFRQIELGSMYYLWGIIRCGGIEDHGRSFIEIRAILLDRQAILPTKEELQKILIEFDFKNITDLNAWNISLPIFEPQKNNPETEKNLPSIKIELLPIVEKICKILPKIANWVLSKILNKILRYLRPLWNFFPNLWKHKEELAKNSKQSVSYVWQHRQEIWQGACTQVKDFREHPDKILPCCWSFLKELFTKKLFYTLKIFLFIIVFLMILAWLWPVSSIPQQPTKHIVPVQNPNDVFMQIKNLDENRNNNKYSWLDFQKKCEELKILTNKQILEGQFFLNNTANSATIWEKIRLPKKATKITPENWECCIILDNQQYRIDISSVFSEFILFSQREIVVEYQDIGITLYVDGKNGKVRVVENLQDSVSDISYVIIQFPKK